MDISAERMRILELIESGQISAEEGLQRLADLPAQAEATSQVIAGPLPLSPASGLPGPTVVAGESAAQDVPASGTTGSAEPGSPAETETPASEPVQPEIVSEAQREDFERWKRYWMIPLWIGVGVTILGGIFMAWALQASGIGFWFLCATVPFILGVLLMVIGTQSRTARWLHVRVQQAPGERPQRIAISMPIPIGLTVWFFRTFRSHIQGLENVPVNIDEILESVRDSTSPDNPIYIRVDEDEDEPGEKVEIYIG
jgi:hypothetical protein